MILLLAITLAQVCRLAKGTPIGSVIRCLRRRGRLFIGSKLVWARLNRKAAERVLSSAALSGLLGGMMSASPAEGAETVVLDMNLASPGQYLDRWMYPFNITPGQRIQAPLFSAINAPDFDDRDGQLLLGWDTTSWGIPSGLPVSRYRIDSVVLSVRESVGGYLFDPTSDAFRTYLPVESPGFTTDSDAGRPIELFGVGFRHGYERLGWPDGATATDPPVFSAGSSFGAIARGTRPVFAADAQGRDVSNHLDSIHLGASGFEVTPFAVGEAWVAGEALPAGSLVPANAELRFTLDVQNSELQRYLQQSLSAGQLGLSLTALHSTPQFGGAPVPNIVTSNHFAWAGPSLTMSYAVLPEWLPGDLDFDEDVDSSDLLTIVSNWTGADIIEPPRSSSDGDLDEDRDIDSADLLIFLSAWTGARSERMAGPVWGETLPSRAESFFADALLLEPVGIVSVPEPGSGGPWLVIGASWWLIGRCRSSWRHVQPLRQPL